MKVRCPKCNETYEVKPYELRNDELCVKCVPNVPFEENDSQLGRVRQA